MHSPIIKYRAWNTHLNVMEHDVHLLDEFAAIISKEYYIKMQFTGLMDDYEKEMYDRDILKIECKHGFNSELLNEFKTLKGLDSINGIGLHFTGIVRMDSLRGLMFENPENGYSEPMFTRHIEILRNHSGIRIIGNELENPELLKQK